VERDGYVLQATALGFLAGQAVAAAAAAAAAGYRAEAIGYGVSAGSLGFMIEGNAVAAAGGSGVANALFASTDGLMAVGSALIA
jgi:hypothetical protein